ncbi:MAG: hypothetical protein BMS9Abin13_559 [Patescibacteria group bacterium]|nr:MAG: hypothetical protein BMS9Abin13_559 [Patescibacteria group bacterium]
MTFKCPFCKLPVIGGKDGYSQHVEECPLRSTHHKTAPLITDSDYLLYRDVSNIKKFCDFFDTANKATRKMLLVCTECYDYGFSNGTGHTVCSCGDTLVNAADYIEEIVLDEHSVPVPENA